MHLDRHLSTTIMEKSVSDSTSSDIGVTGIRLNMENMTFEDIQRQFELLQNSTWQQNPEDVDILKEKSWRIAVITIYSIFILFGFIENSIIMCVLMKNRHLHTPTNIFIMGLAMSDILLCLFNLPFQLHYQLTDQWAFGGALCRVIMPTYGVPVFLSSMSILMIAIDRYMLIVHPFLKRMSTRMAIGLVVAIAIFATIFSIPLIVHMEYEVMDIPAIKYYKTYCIERWKSVKMRRIYTIIIVFLQFFVPLTATTSVYMRISNVLRNRPIKKNEKRKNHKTNRILISIVLLFSICWLPWNLLTLILEFNFKLVTVRYLKLIDVMLRIFAMGSACINPFLYGWLNDNFRKELGFMVKRPGHNRIRQNGNTYTLAEHSRTDNVGEKYTTAVL